MLEELKNMNVDKMSLDEAVSLSAFARILRSEYEAVGTDSPEWLENKTRDLRREIRGRLQDGLEKRLREAKARMDSLKTPQERKNELKREIAELEKQLTTA